MRSLAITLSTLALAPAFACSRDPPHHQNDGSDRGPIEHGSQSTRSSQHRMRAVVKKVYGDAGLRFVYSTR